jgi:DNA-binding transcriptional LysR family regulator
MSAVTLQQLRYFVAVAEEGNVSRAAARLLVAQPSVSAQLRQLERTLGADLFRRHQRGVELTRAGAMFLVEARRTVAAADQAVAVGRTAARGAAGELRVGFIVGTQVEPTSRILASFRTRHPGVRVEFAEHTFADPSAGLVSRDVDVAFVMPPISHDGLEFHTIYEASRVAVVAASHPLAGQTAVSVRELLDDPWIPAETDDALCRDFWLATAHRGGVPARLAPSTRTIDKFVQLIAAGDGVGLAAAWAERAFARPGIAFVPVTDVEPATTALAWRADTANPLVEEFVSVTREELASGR